MWVWVSKIYYLLSFLKGSPQRNLLFRKSQHFQVIYFQVRFDICYKERRFINAFTNNESNRSIRYGLFGSLYLLRRYENIRWCFLQDTFLVPHRLMVVSINGFQLLFVIKYVGSSCIAHLFFMTISSEAVSIWILRTILPKILFGRKIYRV